MMDGKETAVEAYITLRSAATDVKADDMSTELVTLDSRPCATIC